MLERCRAPGLVPLYEGKDSGVVMLVQPQKTAALQWERLQNVHFKIGGGGGSAQTIYIDSTVVAQNIQWRSLETFQ